MPAKKKGVRGTPAQRPAARKKAIKKTVKQTAKKSAPRKIGKAVSEKPAAKKQRPPAVTAAPVVIEPVIEIQPAEESTAPESPVITMEEARERAPKALVISEIFSSIQGEGQYVGVPSTFIRLAGCNLRCVWCDTPYTSWKVDKASEWMMGGILGQVRRLGNRHVVVTGGEPMLQDSVALLTQRLREDGAFITIETAGTVYQPVVCDLMSISPKLANSVPKHREGGRWAVRHESLRYNPEVLKKLMTEYDYQLKFVVQTLEDIEEVRKIAAETGAVAEKVQLMGEGADPGTLFERAQWITEVCRNLGYRYTPRLHIDLWGNERGK
jgi:7-carboxy-7-deazaguanine synthase